MSALRARVPRTSVREPAKPAKWLAAGEHGTPRLRFQINTACDERARTPAPTPCNEGMKRLVTPRSDRYRAGIVVPGTVWT